MTEKTKLKFKLRDPKKDHIVQWPVEWSAAGPDGTPVKVGFIAHFKMLPDKEVDELFGHGVFGRFTDNRKNREGFEKVLTNWSGVEEEGVEAEVPFNEERRDQMLAWADALTALVFAYRACLQGHHEKN